MPCGVQEECWGGGAAPPGPDSRSQVWLGDEGDGDGLPADMWVGTIAWLYADPGLGAGSEVQAWGTVWAHPWLKCSLLLAGELCVHWQR